MRNKIAVILLVLVLASLSHAESYGLFYDFSGAFRNFTMGVSFGVGPSGLIGEEDVYDAISLETCVNKRTITGAPAPETVKAALDQLKG